jgi:threonine/homoserine/homoserine lactone efflux protein
MDALFSFVLAGLALAGSPGPATLSLAATGAAFGARRGLLYMSGLIIGMVAVMAIIASGVAGIVVALPGLTPIIAMASAAYFVYLAFRIATAPPVAISSDHPGGQPSFMSGVFLALVNPKGYAAMAALFSGFVLVSGRLDLDVFAKVSVLLIIITAVNISWLTAGSALTRFLQDPRTSRIINIVFAVLLLASVAFVLVV